MGALSGEPGRSPALASPRAISVIPGTTRWASRNSSYTAPAVTVVSKPRSSTVAPTTTVPSWRGTAYTDEPVHDAAHRPGEHRSTRARKEAQDLSLHGSHGRRGAGGQPAELRRPHAGGEHDGAGGQGGSAAQHDARHRARRTFERHGPGSVHHRPRADRRVEERSDEEAVVDLVVAGSPDGPPHTRGHGRLELPGPATGEPLHPQAEVTLELEQLVAPRPGPRRRRRPRASPWCDTRWTDPRPRLSSAANAGQRRADAKAKASSGSSPWCTSLTGASIPAAAHEAPRPGSGSTTATVMPRPATCQAQARPMAPPPTTTTS